MFDFFAERVLMTFQFGRRWPLMVGGVWQSAWLFVFAAAGTAKDPSTNEGIGKRMYKCLLINPYSADVPRTQS